MIIFLLTLSLVVGCIMYLLSFLVSFKVKNKNKITAFESGFSVVGSLHRTFSIHFFSILVIFVLFDLEIVLLVGSLLAVSKLRYLFLILFVVGRIYIEWYWGKLV
jgi:NADH:ubiquinone oxidoreductase subunit 3 (subunit A)